MLGWLSTDGDVPGGGLPSASGGLPLDGGNGQVVRCRAGPFVGRVQVRLLGVDDEPEGKGRPKRGQKLLQEKYGQVPSTSKRVQRRGIGEYRAANFRDFFTSRLTEPLADGHSCSRWAK
jgi:hypothetical protein